MSSSQTNRVIPIDRGLSKRFRLRIFSDNIVRGLERHPLGTMVTVGLTALVMAATVASVRLLWFDELVTFYIAKTGSLSGIWHALELGADPNPPLTALLVMWSTRLFGNSELAVRLPSVIAGVAVVLLLFSFLQRRLPVIASAIGVLFFMSTRAFDYSYEGRSYAMTACFCILSLVLWRAAVEGRHRMAATVALSLSLMAGISSNYFAVLAIFPIAAGEAVRTIQQRRIELRIWAALFFGGLPIFFYMPLVNRAVARFAPYAWNKPSWDLVNETYRLLLGDSLNIVLLLLFASVTIYLYRHYDQRSDAPRAFPAHEFAAILTLIAYPVLGYIIAIIRAGMISPRFFLPMCFGISMVVALSVHKLFSRSSVLTVALLLIAASWMLARNAISVSGLLEQREALFSLRESLPPRGQLLMPDSLFALPMYHYSQPSVSSRIVFPFDLKAIRKFKGEDSAEQNLWAGKPILPMPVVPFEDVDCSSPNCFIIAPDNNWLLRKLSDDHTPAPQLAAYDGSGHLLERGFLFGMTFGGIVNLFGPPNRKGGPCDPICEHESATASGSFKTPGLTTLRDR